MTPAEKALELKEKCDGYIGYAEVVVDEIIETSRDIYDDTISYTAGYSGHLGMRSYWKEVKQELDKL